MLHRELQVNEVLEDNLRKEAMRASQASAREEVRSQASSTISGNVNFNPQAQRILDKTTRERQLWAGQADPISSEIESPSYDPPSQMDLDTSNDSGNMDDVLASPRSAMPPEAAPSDQKWEQK
eukprot:1937418-Karenia_brevis.AAC.1